MLRPVISVQGLSQLKAFNKTLQKYPIQAAKAGVDAINDVAETVITRASRDITQRYNLPASYIREKFRLQKSTRADVPAIVAARIRSTRLARFDALQLTAAAPRAKGDQRRGIGAGRKQAGASVKVLRGGSRKQIKRAFFMPLRAGKAAGGNGMGLFIREGGGSQLKHLYGISAHQAFRGWLARKSPDITSLLANTFQKRLVNELTKGKK
jgi:hypothetical protein